MVCPRPLVTIAVTAALLGLAGCGGSGSSSVSGAGPGVAAPQQAEQQVAEPAADQAGRADGGAVAAGSPARQADGKQASGTGTSAGAASAALAGVQLIRTADVVVEVGQLATSAARVRAVAQSVGGTVSSEVTTYPESPSDTTRPVQPAAEPASAEGRPDGIIDGPRSARPGESVMVLRVPVASLDQAIDRVVAVGTLLSRTSSSQDVTAELADLGSRVKTQQASVDRVRLLMAKASSLQDVVLLEAELSRRQADLEALQARRAALADRAALSTLTVTLRTAQAAATGDEPGFVAGLRKGWEAIIASTTVLLTVLGGLLPVVILLALIGIPVWRLVLRRRRRARPAPDAAAHHAPAPPAPPAP